MGVGIWTSSELCAENSQQIAEMPSNRPSRGRNNRVEERQPSSRSLLSHPITFLVALAASLIPLYIYSSQFRSSMPNKPTVVVVGGGLAGLSATIEASRNNAFVVLLDKEKRLGGNSAKASSGINAARTKWQTTPGDSPEALIQDTLKSGAGLCNEELVRVLAEESTDQVDNFLPSFNLSFDQVTKCGGHSFARTHRPSIGADGKAKNVGFEIVSALINYINSLGEDKVKVITGAKVIKLLTAGDQNNLKVTGVTYQLVEGNQEPIDLPADAVILTSGGYGADNKEGGLLKEFVPSVASLSTTNGPFALGEGMKLARDIGAELTLMDQVQIHPTSFVDPSQPAAGTKFLAPEALRAVGGILFNHEGKRFVDELGLRNHVTDEIFKHCAKMQLPTGEGSTVAYLVLNGKAVEMYQKAALAFYISKGFIKEYPNFESFAQAYNLNVENIRNAIEQYNSAAAKGKDELTGKTTFPVTFSMDEPIFVMMITPSIHYTMGGIKIDADTHAINKHTQRPIGHLYAAGEASGGVHGGNRLAGNSLLECVVFGRRAGRTAAREASQ